MPAPKNNKNATKADQPLTSHLHIRCTAKQKAGWVKAAWQDEKRLSEWVIDKLQKPDLNQPTLQ